MIGARVEDTRKLVVGLGITAYFQHGVSVDIADGEHLVVYTGTIFTLPHLKTLLPIEISIAGIELIRFQDVNFEPIEIDTPHTLSHLSDVIEFLYPAVSYQHDSP